MTPREFRAVVVGYANRNQRDHTLLAWAVACIVNGCAPPGRFEEPITVKELLGKPSDRERRRNPSTREVEEEQRELARAFPDKFPQWAE